MKKNKEIILTKDNWQTSSMIIEPILLEKGIRFNLRDYGFFGQMILQLDRMFWTFKEVKSFEYPKTWWDAFKLRYFPLWLLKLKPATMTRVTIKEVVPQLPKKYNSKLFKIEKDVYLPSIPLKDPEEYDFTFDKFNKIEDYER